MFVPRLRLDWIVVVLCMAVMVGAPAQSMGQRSLSTDRPLRQISTALERLSGQIHPSVVQVVTQRYELGQGTRGRAMSRRQGTGSGVFVDSTGYIVTNAHVIEGAYRVHVRLPPGQQKPPGEQSIVRPRGDLRAARIVGLDRETDIAVLKVDIQKAPSLPFGNSDVLRPGHLVVAFGSPLGLESSVSMGVVSATARQLQPDDPMVYVQTDAPINPGSSGGPLVNGQGEIVGINTLILSQSGGSDGLGFAAPSNIVQDVYRQIREHGHVRRGIIGTHAQTLTPELAEALQMSPGYRVVLADVFPGSPAARAGLRPGDIVATLNGKRMENARQLDVNLYGALGSIARLTIVRADTTFRVGVRVVERDGQRRQLLERADPTQHRIGALRIVGLPLTDTLAERIPGLRSRDGVLVASSSGPPTPWGDRLQSRDVIHQINGVRVQGPADVRQRLEGVPASRRFVAHVLRDGRLQYLLLHPYGRATPSSSVGALTE